MEWTKLRSQPRTRQNQVLRSQKIYLFSSSSREERRSGYLPGTFHFTASTFRFNFDKMGLRLSFACWDYDRMKAIEDGRIRPEGIELIFLNCRVEET